MNLLRRIHIAIYAAFVKYFRIRRTLQAFRQAHSIELSQTPVYNWPVTLARQSQEIEGIKAGRLDSAAEKIVDRKSWSWPFMPSCSSEDHEILTRRGFIPVADMREDDVFATRDEARRLSWQRATVITKEPYKGKMVHAEGRNIDTLVTPNHRMVVRYKKFYGHTLVKQSTEKFVAAAAVMERLLKKRDILADIRRCEVPISTPDYEDSGPLPASIRMVPPRRNTLDRSQPYEVDLDTWIQFMALYLADGSCDGTSEGIEYGDGKSAFDQHRPLFDSLLTEFEVDPHTIIDRLPGHQCRVRISCKDTSTKRAEVAELLQAMGWGSGNWAGFKIVNKALWCRLFPFGNSYTKYVPAWIKELPVEKLELYVRWLKKADGYQNSKNSWAYTSCSKRLAEDVAYILIRVGYAVQILERPVSSYGVLSGATAYSVHFKVADYDYIQKIEEVDYDGMVYCPSVPNGTICLRRNGKIYWTGNSVNRLSVPIIKSSPYNLRRMSRTPVPRRAMNLIKGALIMQAWDVRPVNGVDPIDNDDLQKERINITKKVFHHPNNQDSFQTFIEQGTEDFLVLGAFVAELRLTVDPERPIKSWPVNVESVRIFPSWAESTPDMPHYAQMTGLKGERGAILFYDDELLYIRDNPSTDNPFGLGKMEVAFQSVNDFLGIQGMSGRAGTDAVHKTWLWWEAPQCFDDQTEVLVKRGWLLWKDTRSDDLFATRNKNGVFEWQLATQLHKKHYIGPMWEFRSRSLSICITPNHRMYGRYVYHQHLKKTHTRRAYEFCQTYSDLDFVQASKMCDAMMVRPGGARRYEGSESVRFNIPVKCHSNGEDPTCKRCRNRLCMRRLMARRRAGIIPEPFSRTPKDFRIPVTSQWKGVKSSKFKVGDWQFNTKDWAAFLGIWMAEGWTSGSSLTGRRFTIAASVESPAQYAERTHSYKVGISQSKDANPLIHKQIVTLLRRMKLPFYEDTEGHGLLFTDHSIWEHLSSFGNKYTKFVPDYIKDASVDVIAVFIDWAVKGDGWLGTTPGSGRGYFTVSKRLADDLQELFQKIGKAAVISLRQPTDASQVPEGRIANSSLGYTVRELTVSEESLFPSFTKGHNRKQDKYTPHKVLYDGLVYCATVPNGTLYTRKNGHPFWSGNSDTAYQAVRRHIQNELEGQAKVSLIGGMKKPDVLEIQPVTEDDLLLGWQELLIRMIANAFDMSAMALGVEHDINRAVGEVLDDKDFRSAVVPVAKRLQEAFTRRVLHGKLGWHDLEFVFLNLDDPDAETKMALNAQLYSTNSITPNQIRKSMNMEPLESVFADMTQFECMLTNIQAMQQSQNNLADAGLQRQAKAQQMMQRMQPSEQQEPETVQDTSPSKELPPGQQQKQLPPGRQQPPQQQGMEKVTPGSVSRGGQPPSPKALALPKFPIASSSSGKRYNAKDIAQMPVNQVQDIWKFNGQKVSWLLQSMDQQEPGILETLSDEVKEFFEQRLADEKKERGSLKVPQRILDQWKKELVRKGKQGRNRPVDYTQWLYKRGGSGKPGRLTDNGRPSTDSAGVARPVKVGGKPGRLNPTQKG